VGLGKLELIAEQKHFGSPFVVAYDEEGERFPHVASILVPRKKFEGVEVPKKIRVVIEWE